MSTLKRLLSIMLIWTTLTSLCACNAGQKDTTDDSYDLSDSTDESDDTPDIPDEHWVTCWGTAIQKGEAEKREPTAMSIENNTLRQQVRTSLGGENIKLTFSNEYGDTPVTLKSVHIAKLIEYGKSTIDTSTDTAITFSGNEEVIIPAGESVTSDEIAFSMSSLDCLSVSVQFGSELPDIYTIHTISKCTSWVGEGNRVSDESLSQKNDKQGFYFLQRIDVLAPIETAALVCLGDSITDGQSSGGDALGSYPDQLTDLLSDDSYELSVINMGIGGNRIFYGAGDPCKDRIVRDVIEIPGVKYCIILIGINDIANSTEDISATLIEEYKKMIDLCHDNGITVIGATITPDKGHKHYSELHERVRKTVNDFITDPDSGFDAYIDMSAAVADGSDAEQLKKEYASSDYLHLNKTGYAAMAREAFEALKDILE